MAAVGQSSAVASYDRSPGAPPVGVTRLPQEHAIVERAHAHDFLVLFHAREASGRFQLDGRWWTVGDGDLFVVAPGQMVSFEGRHDEMVSSGWVVWFPADVIRAVDAHPSWRAHPLLFPFARGADRAQRLRIPPASGAAWDAMVDALESELRERRDGYREAALAHLTLLLVAVSRLTGDVGEALRAAEEPLLAAVFDVIERRFADPISLADVAGELALSPGHLTTVVRRRTGRTVQQWLTQRRMQQARRLLAETSLTVSAIGHRVGYPDPGYFIRRFRDEHGTTPARWRRDG